jgi:hypothetical protein
MGRLFQIQKQLEIAVMKQTSIALAAVVLLAGVSAASAAPLRGAKMAPKASDTLTLTAAQQETAWNDLYMGSLNQKTPAGFDAKVGVALPTSVTTAAVTTKASSDVPALKPYRFAMVQKRLVIVNPSDHKIADVIAR